MLSRRLFDTLGARERTSLEPYKSAHGTLADGSFILFYGVISLPGRVREQTIHETFIVNQLKEEAILGMPFPEKHQCHMDFQKSVVVMAEKDLVCVDKFDRPLVGGVLVVRDCKFQEDPWQLSAVESTAGGSLTLGWFKECTERSD